MPLFMNENLKPADVPTDLDPEELVFYCRQTGEVFRNFEDYFTRILLLNSCVWECAVTGQKGLTYQEALEQEASSIGLLKNFPDALVRGVLFIVGLTSRNSLSSLCDDVYSFVRDRYFIGEPVEYIGARGRRKQGIVRRIEWSAANIGGNLINGLVIINSANTENGGQNGACFRYFIEPHDDDGCIRGSSIQRALVSVDASEVVNRVNKFTRSHCKMVLKICCEMVDNVWVVTDNMVNNYNIATTDWRDVSIGPLPVFPNRSFQYEQPAVCSDEEGVSVTSGRAEQGEEDQIEDDDDEDVADDDSEVATAEQESSRYRGLILSMLKEAKGMVVPLSPDLRERLNNDGLINQNDYNAVRAAVRQSRIDRREQERARRRAEKEQLLEWRRSRDDLCCDDHKPMPDLPTVCLPKNIISEESFGDCLSLLEFFHSFGDLIHLDQYFPNGIHLTTLYMALVDSRPSGIYGKLVCALLERVFCLQTEEDGDEEDIERIDESYAVLENSELDNKFYSQYVEEVTKRSEEMRAIHGVSVRYLPLDGYSLTEVLRLYLTISGYFTGCKNARFRYLSRGGFKCIDDQAFQFVLKRPDLVNRLRSESVYQLEPTDRLAILIVLRDQLLTFSAFRALLDKYFERMKTMRVELRQLTSIDSRLEKEALNSRLRTGCRQDDEDSATAVPINQCTKKIQSVLAKHVFDSPEALESAVNKLRGLADCILYEVMFDKLNLIQIDLIRELQRQYTHETTDRLMREIFELQLKSGTLTAMDRAYRRFWFCRSVGSLIIEDYDPVVGSCCEATPLDRVRLSGGGKDGGDSAVSTRELLLICSGTKQTCPVHGDRSKRARWKVVQNCELFDSLLRSLNSRGVRETELLDICNNFRMQIDNLFANADPALLELPNFLDTSINDHQETDEQVLSGSIEEFKKRLVDSKMCSEKEVEGGSAVDKKDLQWYAAEIVRLLDAINPNCIKNPVVCTVNGTNEDGEEIVTEIRRIQKWKQSISEACSYSAVLLHLKTMENCINWKKSLSHMRCRHCRRKGDASSFILCTVCERPYHVDCAESPPKKSPNEKNHQKDSSWKCDICIRTEMKNSSEPLPKRRKATTDTIKAECCAEESRKTAAKNDVKQSQQQQQQLTEQLPLCTVCTSTIAYRKFSIACSQCTAVFHTKCVNVKKSEMKATLWQCSTCASSSTEDSTVVGVKEDDLKVSRSGRILRRPKTLIFPSYVSRQNGTLVYSEDEFHSSVNSNHISMISTRFRGSNGTLKIKSSYDDVDDTERQSDRCKELILSLSHHEDSWPFRKPVSRRIAPDYYEIVDSPMDLSTIMTKLQDGQYSTVGQVVSDIDLMFQNCYMYNEPTAEVYGCGERLQLFCKSQLEELHMRADALLLSLPVKRRRGAGAKNTSSPKE